MNNTKNKFIGSFSAKLTAFILLVLSALIAAGGITGIVAMVEGDIYTKSEAKSKREVFEGLVWDDAARLSQYIDADSTQDAESYCIEQNVALVNVISVDGEVIWEWSSGMQPSSEWDYVVNPNWNVNDTQVRTVRIALSSELNLDDKYALADKGVGLVYRLRYWVYPIVVLSCILLIVCFAFLMHASGYHAGEVGVRASWGTKIPFDLLTAGLGFAIFFPLDVIYNSYGYSRLGEIIIMIAYGITALVLFVAWSMSLALRIKLGILFNKTFIYWTLVHLWRALKWICRQIKSFVNNIPLVWKPALAFLLLSAIELVAMCAAGWDGSLVLLWILEKLAIFVVLQFCTLMLNKLKKGGKALAEGDLSYHVNTDKMVLDFKEHGENLNSIAVGMTLAVDQRVKSERMKTELITNVSHDIKTPLTSIINYADLISKEECDNEKINEYSDALLRQSERLKKLIEDLVEVSKASTGNLEVLLAPCEVGVLLTQSAGEYEQRLEASKLELVTRQPEHPVRILADGRRLWRVFDNLLNNVCKYAQEGTRVYLTLEEQGTEALISFKNTSRSQLDVSADELMERFVRGDSSRNTEGNGLGLSIAKSLTELQNGKLELFVDGDLFKVVLSFPLIQ